MAVAFVQKSAVENGNDATPGVITLTGVGAGNFLIACVSAWVNAAATMSDDRHGAWTALFAAPRSGGTNGYVTVLYRANTLSGTVVVTAAPGGGDYAWQVAEFSGVALASVGDGTPTTSTGSSAAPSTGNYTSTNAEDLLIAAMGIAVTQGSITENASGAGFTQLGEYLGAAGGENVLDWGYKIVAATGTYADAWTLASSGDWYAGIGAVKSGAPPTTPAIVASFETFPKIKLQQVDRVDA